MGRDVVELSRHRRCPQGFKRFGRHELRLCQPGQQTVAIVDPVDFRVDWGGNRIEEIQAEGFVFLCSRGRRWNRVSLTQKFSRIKRRIGLPAGCTMYGIRHFFCTHAIKEGVRIWPK